jgi:hypothetical protein
VAPSSFLFPPSPTDNILIFIHHHEVQLLDKVAGDNPQLSPLEFSLLATAVVSAASGPLLPVNSITEFLAPSAAAFCAAIGIGAVGFWKEKESSYETTSPFLSICVASHCTLLLFLTGYVT